MRGTLMSAGVFTFASVVIAVGSAEACTCDHGGYRSAPVTYTYSRPDPRGYFSGYTIRIKDNDYRRHRHHKHHKQDRHDHRRGGTRY